MSDFGVNLYFFVKIIKILVNLNIFNYNRPRNELRQCY